MINTESRLSPLVGHNEAYKSFMSKLETGQLAPCWLLSGPRGIGKRNLAIHVACSILVHGAQNFISNTKDLVERQVLCQSYPNFYLIQSLLGDEGKSNEIGIQSIRDLQSFLAQHPAIPGWRVVVIDCIDQLNRFAGNALLKIAEEPPNQTLILGICHQLGKVLPTLRSRFQMMSLSHPSFSFPSLEDQELWPYTFGNMQRFYGIKKHGGVSLVQKVERAMEGIKRNSMDGIKQIEKDIVKQEGGIESVLWILQNLLYRTSQTTFSGDAIDLWFQYSAFLRDIEGKNLDKAHVFWGAFIKATKLEDSSRTYAKPDISSKTSY